MSIYRPNFMFVFVIIAILSLVTGVSAQNKENAVAFQNEKDAVAFVEQFLAEGVSVVTATKDELIEAVKQALAANPDLAAEIVKAVGALRPDALEDIVAAALDAAPDRIDVIKQAAQRVRLQGLPVTKPFREEPSPVRP